LIREVPTLPLLAVFVTENPQILVQFCQLTEALPNWQIVCLPDASAVRAQLTSTVPDLLLTTELLATDSGESLLDYACQHSPTSIRVLISSPEREQSLLATSHSTQLLLHLPLQQSEVLALFQRVQRLQLMPFTAHSRYQLGKINTLPVLQNHYQNLQRLLSDDDCNNQTLAANIAREAPLAAKLMQLANSAYLGFKRQTLDLTEVVTRLGRSRIKAVLFAIQLHNQYQHKIQPQLHQQLLENAFELATLASQLAKTQQLDEPQQASQLAEKAFLAGLMQVLGPLVLLAELPLSHQQLSEEDMFQEGIPDHCLISAYLLQLWGFTEDVCSAVMYRLSLHQVEQPALLQTILHMSSYIVLYRRQRQAEQLPVLCWTALQQFQLTAAFTSLQQH
jgi:HD-like signal output (HDOD) protein